MFFSAIRCLDFAAYVCVCPCVREHHAVYKGMTCDVMFVFFFFLRVHSCLHNSEVAYMFQSAETVWGPI